MLKVPVLRKTDDIAELSDQELVAALRHRAIELDRFFAGGFALSCDLINEAARRLEARDV
jgi:hypothetical protein